MPFDEDELAKAVDAVGPVAAKCTVPLSLIKGSPDGPPLDYATGVLVQVGDDARIFTAAHFTDDGVDRTDRSIAAVTERGRVLLSGAEIFGTLMPPSGNRLPDDTVDAALLKLKPETADALRSSGLEFLQHDQIAVDFPVTATSPVVLFGYPISRREETGKVVYHDALPALLKRLRRADGSDARHEILLSYPGPGTWAYNHHGYPIRPDPADGLSGGGIWEYRPRVRLIGIQHTWGGEDQIVMGTSTAVYFIYWKADRERTRSSAPVVVPEPPAPAPENDAIATPRSEPVEGDDRVLQILIGVGAVAMIGYVLVRAARALLSAAKKRK